MTRVQLKHVSRYRGMSAFSLPRRGSTDVWAYISYLPIAMRGVCSLLPLCIFEYVHALTQVGTAGEVSSHCLHTVLVLLHVLGRDMFGTNHCRAACHLVCTLPFLSYLASDCPGSCCLYWFLYAYYVVLFIVCCFLSC